jgi:enamine deaminase RidA (YjgF/YER057c/UK114 family)
MEQRELIPTGVAYPPDFGSPTALAVEVTGGRTIYVSGMIAWDENRQMVGVGDPAAQTKQALHNMQATLQAGGADLHDIVQITFYLTDIRHKNTVWDVRKQLFGDHRPASTLVEVSHLVDPNAVLEISAIAHLR